MEIPMNRKPLGSEFTIRGHSPCGKKCPERWVSSTSRCHSTCPKWAKHIAKCEAERQMKIAAMKLEEDIFYAGRPHRNTYER